MDRIKCLEQMENQACNKKRGVKGFFKAKNGLVRSIRIRDLTSKKDHNYLGLREDS